MPRVVVLLDPEWVKRELLLRGKNGRWLEENGISEGTITRLLRGLPVAPGTLLKLNALLEVTPYAPEFQYVAKGMAG